MVYGENPDPLDMYFQREDDDPLWYKMYYRMNNILREAIAIELQLRQKTTRKASNYILLVFRLLKPR